MTVCKLLARMVELVLMGSMSICVFVILGFLDAIVTQTLMSAAHHLVGMVEIVRMASPSIIASAKQASQVCSMSFSFSSPILFQNGGQ